MSKRVNKLRKTLSRSVTIVLTSFLMAHQAFGLNQCNKHSTNFYAKQPFHRRTFTSAILQFFDPSQSSLSEPLTYLWYRQIYESISDLPRAGILRMLDEQNTCPMAKALISTAIGSHDLAAKVALSAQAQFAVWGELVGFSQGGLTIAASLTVPNRSHNITENSKADQETPEWNDWLSMPRGIRDRRVPLVIPSIPASRINFVPFTISLGDLYGTSAAVRCARENDCPKGSIKLYDKPFASSKGVDISVGDLVDIDIQSGHRLPIGKFIPVRIKKTGKRGWIYAYYLSFLPTEVYVGLSGSVFGYTEPVVRINNGTQIPPGSFLLVLRSVLRGPVRDARRWFLTLTPDGKKLWLQSSPDLSTVWPANFVNFAAGLYRYALGKYRSAYDAFSVFTRRSNEQKENVATSLAYQFMAACLLAGKDGSSREAFNKAIVLLNRAIALTPFDGRVRLLRAYVRFEWAPVGSARKMAMEGNYIYSDLRSASNLLSPMSATDATQIQLLTLEVAKYFPNPVYTNSGVPTLKLAMPPVGVSESLSTSRPCVMRRGPNSSATVVQTLNVGDKLYPTGILEDNWLHVENVGGISGWIADSCVDK